jgi:hypothetical protein
MFELQNFMSTAPKNGDPVGMRAFRMHCAEKVEERWAFLHSDMHAAAYALNPGYWHLIHDILKNKEVVDGLQAILKRLAPDLETAMRAYNEFSKLYAMRQGRFASDMAALAALDETVEPYSWWGQYGQDSATLTPMAVKIEAAAPASSSCEQNWSAVDFILNKRRTKLTPARTEKLVYVYGNIRALARNQTRNADEKFLSWANVDGEELTPLTMRMKLSDRL